MAWRVARSLDTFLAQLNAARPERSKASDGAIGDAAHASRSSDHNPWYGPGIVTARDFTHDPAHGVDIAAIVEELRASRDGRIKYLIANGKIMAGACGPSPWTWRSYSGTNPHRKHFHLSVVASPACDDASPWQLPMFDVVSSVTPAPQPPGDSSVLRRGSTGARVSQIQRVINAWYPWMKLAVDGDYGPATENAVREFQRRAGITADGIAGPVTLARLGF
jgi:hypothetical protein